MPFLETILSRKCIWQLRTCSLQGSFKRVLIYLFSSMGRPNSTKILYKISMLTLEVCKSLMYGCIVFTFFSSICEVQNIWSIMLNFTGWSPVISCTYVLFVLKVVQVTLFRFWNTYTLHCTMLKNVYKGHSCGFRVSVILIFWNINFFFFFNVKWFHFQN